MTFKTCTAALAMAATMAISGCDYMPFGYTPMKEIVSAPGQFEGKEGKLKGRVKGIVKLLGVKAYTLDDGTAPTSATFNSGLADTLFTLQ